MTPEEYVRLRLPPIHPAITAANVVQSCYDQNQTFLREASEEIDYHEYQSAILRSIASLEECEPPDLTALQQKPEKVNWKKEGF
jgi:hypothetical protein